MYKVDEIIEKVIEIYHLDIIVQQNNKTEVYSFACGDMQILNETAASEVFKICGKEEYKRDSTYITIKVDNTFIMRYKLSILISLFYDKFKFDLFEPSLRSTLLMNENTASKAPKVKQESIKVNEIVWNDLDLTAQLDLLANYDVQVDKVKKKRGRPSKQNKTK